MINFLKPMKAIHVFGKGGVRDLPIKDLKGKKLGMLLSK